MFDKRESISRGLMSLYWVSEGVDREKRLRNGDLDAFRPLSSSNKLKSVQFSMVFRGTPETKSFFWYRIFFHRCFEEKSISGRKIPICRLFRNPRLMRVREYQELGFKTTFIDLDPLFINTIRDVINHFNQSANRLINRSTNQPNDYSANWPIGGQYEYTKT